MFRIRRTAAKLARAMKVEISVPVTVVFWCGTTQRVLALIDTGCSIFAAAPRKIFPAGTLERARQPLRFSSVTAGGVSGGTEGATLMVTMPLCDTLGGLQCHCPGVFVYQAGVSNDLILGWPFLVAYELMPCRLESCIIPRDCVQIDTSQFQADRTQLQQQHKSCEQGQCCALRERSPATWTPPRSTPVGGSGEVVAITRSSDSLLYFWAGCLAMLSVILFFLLHLCVALGSGFVPSGDPRAQGSQVIPHQRVLCSCQARCACKRECLQAGRTDAWHPPLRPKMGALQPGGVSPCPCSQEALLLAMGQAFKQPPVMQADHHEISLGEEVPVPAVAAVTVTNGCTCATAPEGLSQSHEICNFCSGTPPPAGDVAQIQTGPKPQEPLSSTTAQTMCACRSLNSLTAEDIRAQPELIQGLFQECGHQWEVQLKQCSVCALDGSDNESDGIFDVESETSRGFDQAADQLCGGWGYHRSHGSYLTTVAPSMGAHLEMSLATSSSVPGMRDSATPPDPSV